MIRPALGAALLLAATAGPAWATGGIACSGDGVVANLGVGHMPVAAVISAYVEAGGQSWTTHPEQTAGTPITIGQDYWDDRMTLVTFTDEIVNEVLGELLLFSVSEGEDHALGGVLRMVGAGAWAVTCGEG